MARQPRSLVLPKRSTSAAWLFLATTAASVTTLGAADGLDGQQAPQKRIWSPLSWEWRSQYGQDRLVFESFFAADELAAVGGLRARGGRRGTFVELGAADGFDKSNTFGFEKNFDWHGVLIEANDGLFEKLNQSRPGSFREHTCIATVSGEFAFKNDGLGSGLVMHRVSSPDPMAQRRWCRTLPEVLELRLGADAHVDYLSLDLEGGELDVLETLDFNRLTIDVISIEVQLIRPARYLKRMAQILRRGGYRFFDRAVIDEIWVRDTSHGIGCCHPGLQTTVGLKPPLREGELLPTQGWSRIRDAARWLWRQLRTGQKVDIWKVPLSTDFAPTVAQLLNLYAKEEPSAYQATCSLGMMTVSVIHTLMESVDQGSEAALTGELKSGSILHPLEHKLRMIRSIEYGEVVKLAESEGKTLAISVPFPRSWHEISFVEILESGWPLFGILDIIARKLSRRGFLIDRTYGDGVEMLEPARLPRPSCQLRAPPLRVDDHGGAGDEPHIVIVSRTLGTGKRFPLSASDDIAMDLDACGMLGVAAARFHGVRALVRRNLAEQRRGGRQRKPDRFVPLVNWTLEEPGPDGDGAGCLEGVPLGGFNPMARCSDMSFEDCAAIDDTRMRAVPRRCLRVRPAPGRSVRIRRSTLLRAGPLEAWLAEGESALRGYIRRYGLLNALWTLTTEPFAPPVEGGPVNPKSWDGDGQGESALAVLQSLQELLLEHERAE